MSRSGDLAMCHTRLLLAEDNADHQHLIVSGLTRVNQNIDVSVARTRDEVEDRVKNDRFDCLILDYCLPPFSAPEILHAVQAHIRETPVVIISSRAEQRVVIESMRTGVADFVPKEEAVRGEPLWASIQRAMDRARRSEEERRLMSRRIDSLQQEADRDPLTGLYNRRFASRLLADNRHRSDRRQPTSCVLIDLDSFKAINDRLGHPAGDKVLTTVAATIREHAGASNPAIRWGGEEFFVVLASTSPARAWAWTESLRRAIESLEVRFDNEIIRVTASFGIATVPTAMLSEETAKRADAALYLAKHLGKNRACTAEMAAMHDIAGNVSAVSTTSWAERADSLLSRCSNLGSTQIEHTGRHSRLVRDWAIQVGRALRLTGVQLNLLQYAASLHDIGKLAVPEALLAKPSSLTEEERYFVDQHARFGGELCRSLRLPVEVTSTVERHHDRFDRVGASSDTAIWAQIVAVADAYVTMISNRPYAVPRTPEQALAELRSQRGKQFNPVVVDAMEVAVRVSWGESAAA